MTHFNSSWPGHSIPLSAISNLLCYQISLFCNCWLPLLRSKACFSFCSFEMSTKDSVWQDGITVLVFVSVSEWERRVPTNNWYERTQVWMWVVISIPINLRIEFKEIPIQVLYPGSRQGPLQQWYVGWPGRATGSWLATRTTFSHPHISNTNTKHIHRSNTNTLMSQTQIHANSQIKHIYPHISNTNTQHIHKSNTNTPMSQTQTHTHLKHKYPDISDTKHKNPHILNTNTQHKYIHLKYTTFSDPAH